MFVPCTLAPALVRIVGPFVEKYPNVTVAQDVETVQVLMSRIENGQTPDVFLCVGGIEIARLEEAGLVQHREDFCSVGLALVVPEENQAQVQSLSDLAKPAVRRVAIGAEGTSPGHQTRELLRRRDLWEQVEPKVVVSRLPTQLLRFAGMQKADAAIAYAACLRAHRGEGSELEEYQRLAQGVRAVAWLDHEEYGVSVVCAAATIEGCPNPSAGRAFIDFLRSEEAQALLTRSGFTGPAAPRRSQ